MTSSGLRRISAAFIAVGMLAIAGDALAWGSEPTGEESPQPACSDEAVCSEEQDQASEQDAEPTEDEGREISEEVTAEDISEDAATSEDATVEAGTTEDAAEVEAPADTGSGRATASLTRAQSQGSAAVTMVDNEFQPQTLTITEGTTVTWTNEGPDNPHTATADDGSFDSGEVPVGGSFSHTFETAGTFPYHCAFHGAPGGVGMSGTITVEAAGEESGDGGEDPGDGAGEPGEDDPEVLADGSLPVTGGRGWLAAVGLALIVAGAALWFVSLGRMSSLLIRGR